MVAYKGSSTPDWSEYIRKPKQGGVICVGLRAEVPQAAASRRGRSKGFQKPIPRPFSCRLLALGSDSYISLADSSNSLTLVRCGMTRDTF